MQYVQRIIFAVLTATVFFAPCAAVAQTVKQIKLTEPQIQGFIASQKDMEAITEKMRGSTSDKPDPRIQEDLEAAAKKHGFANFSAYDEVAANIAMIMAGFDPQTKVFTEPQMAIRKEIAEIKADKSIPEEEKKKMLEELSEAEKSAAPILYPNNIELVKTYFDRIEAVLK